MRHQSFRTALRSMQLPRTTTIRRPPTVPKAFLAKPQVHPITYQPNWSKHFPGKTLHKTWYTDPDVPFPWSTVWDEWEGLCLFYEDVNVGGTPVPKIDKLFKDMFDVPGVVHPLAYIIQHSYDTFVFTAGGRYYLHDDGALFVSDREFGSHREFVRHALRDGGWELPDVEVERRPGRMREVGSSPRIAIGAQDESRLFRVWGTRNAQKGQHPDRAAGEGSGTGGDVDNWKLEKGKEKVRVSVRLMLSGKSENRGLQTFLRILPKFPREALKSKLNRNLRINQLRVSMPAISDRSLPATTSNILELPPYVFISNWYFSGYINEDSANAISLHFQLGARRINASFVLTRFETKRGYITACLRIQDAREHRMPSRARANNKDAAALAAEVDFATRRQKNLRRQRYMQLFAEERRGSSTVYLPAIAGHVPSPVVKAVADIIEFCYLVRRSVIDEDTLAAIEAAITRFHAHREIFRFTSRPDGFSLPRQHSIIHYPPLIRNFGAPNGLCSSITESKHIKAVKRPYRRTNHHRALSQMLLTNQRLDKLAAARADFTARGMMAGSLLPPPPVPARDTPSPPPEDPNDERVDAGAIEGPTCVGEVKLAKSYGKLTLILTVHFNGAHHIHTAYLEQPRLCELIRRFLFDQLNPDAPVSGGLVALDQCPEFSTEPRAVFYAPSDISGVGGMHHERIRATKTWYRGPPRYDCVFLEHDTEAAGFRGLHAARVRLFFRFKFRDVEYPCALIHWFSARGDSPCPDTGMWIVTPDSERGGPSLAVVHLDSILRGAHLVIQKPGQAKPWFEKPNQASRLVSAGFGFWLRISQAKPGHEAMA
ncbi:hypothetical protein C8R43DRAFT_1114272 [Mycena crocata]|nr:hypothetical protein C8R43DRAFT_1114272 [Mycena crocata]